MKGTILFSRVVVLRIASLGATGAATLGDNVNFSLSADGKFLAFASDAANVVPADTNNERDVFVAPISGVWIPAARIVQLGIDDTVSQVNLGNWQPRGSISGEKWKDRDRDQMHDANEVNLENWQIYIDSNGNQQLDGSVPSMLSWYQVSMVRSPLWAPLGNTDLESS